MVHQRKPPSQSWLAFLNNHAKDIVSIDFFTVPTATFRVLYVFLILLNDRREVIHFNVTDSPSVFWTGQQIVQAFPWETAPRYLLRDRDRKYGEPFIRRVESMDTNEVLISAQSPWQNPYVERIIASIRRECLDHVIIFNISSWDYSAWFCISSPVDIPSLIQFTTIRPLYIGFADQHGHLKHRY